MGSYRLIKRGVLFSAEGDAITRADLASGETEEEVVTGSGKPVPVLFGTRYLNPTVVGYAAPGRNVYLYYRSSSPAAVTSFPSGNSDDVRMTVLTLRMVICVGSADRVNQYLLNGTEFTVDPRPSSVSHTSNSLYGYARHTVSTNDAHIYPDAIEGGLGYPRRFDFSYNSTVKFSEFWFMDGGQLDDSAESIPIPNRHFIANEAIDLGSQALGVTSFYFDGFNFGGKLPPDPWQLLVTRTDYQTRRTRDNVYPYTWYSNNSYTQGDRSVLGGLHIVRDLNDNGATSMNPVMALHEMLTNPDWGEGIEDDQIDEGSFVAAAIVCKNELLDYCAVFDKLGGVDKLINSVTDYIDGLIYYEAATDKVRLKLIRQDYTFSNIPSFDESNISEIKNYQRQHGHELINSVTINYHDALKGSNESVTVHDLEASLRVGKTVSASLNYDGCATRQSAVRTAERELTSLSKAVISFTAKVHATEVIGLGDAVLVSYQDLDLARIVMRVSKIGYGDGTTGGITLHLIQDVFANLNTFDDIVGDEPLPDDTPVLIDLQDNVKFLESGDFDLTNLTDDDGNPAIINPVGRYIKGGVLYDNTVTDETVVNIAGSESFFPIGTLVDTIPALTTDPDVQEFSIRVNVGIILAGNRYIRINNEIMEIDPDRHVLLDVDDSNRGLQQFTIIKRAQRDTVSPPTRHAAGSDVWFLDDLWVDNKEWDGAPVVTVVQQGIYIDRELIQPDIDFINRHTLPYPPSAVTVANQYSANLRIDQAIAVSWVNRLKYQDQATVVTLMKGDDVILSHQFTSATTNFNIGVDAIGLTGQHDLCLLVGAKYQQLNSWQSWKFNIDWSSETRQKTGWNYRWAFDWGGDDASGWGFDWNKTYGDFIQS